LPIARQRLRICATPGFGDGALDRAAAAVVAALVPVTPVKTSDRYHAGHATLCETLLAKSWRGGSIFNLRQKGAKVRYRGSQEVGKAELIADHPRQKGARMTSINSSSPFLGSKPGQKTTDVSSPKSWGTDRQRRSTRQLAKSCEFDHQSTAVDRKNLRSMMPAEAAGRVLKNQKTGRPTREVATSSQLILNPANSLPRS
jgi:hypothetical protein